MALRVWNVILAGTLLASSGCSDQTREAKRPKQHWRHPVSNKPGGQQKPHPGKRHEGSKPQNAGPKGQEAPIAKTEPERDAGAELDAGSKTASPADASLEVFTP